MGTAAQQPDQTQTVMAQIVLVLLSGQTMAAMTGHLLPLLALFGIPPQAGVKVASLALPHFEPPLPDLGPAGRANERINVVRRAQYLVNAATRLVQPEHSIDAERRHLESHLNAVRARTEATARVDKAAALHGPELGWHAILDSRTTPECRAAHGHNFSAFNAPKIGYPGTLHGGTCRCRAGTPFAGARSVDAATLIHHADVIPFPVVLTNPRRNVLDLVRSVFSQGQSR